MRSLSTSCTKPGARRTTFRKIRPCRRPSLAVLKNAARSATSSTIPVTISLVKAFRPRRARCGPRSERCRKIRTASQWATPIRTRRADSTPTGDRHTSNNRSSSNIAYIQLEMYNNFLTTHFLFKVNYTFFIVFSINTFIDHD
uniref:Uncharacterized protein n=1 Tax=Anopheles atroparvus TaxID=41427 RepID=A0AAG5DEE7_ANOAO